MRRKAALFLSVVALGGCGPVAGPPFAGVSTVGAAGVPPASGGYIGDGCNYDADCRPGLACSYGSCDAPPNPGCQSDADCGDGNLCDANGTCWAPSLPPGECSTDSDCGPGAYCQSGACVSV